VNLDGYALPIKKLKGTETVESLDLSGKNLGVASAIVIALLISVNGALTSLNLSHNQLCGVNFMGGTYTTKGITAIADALRVNGSLTSLNLSSNHFGAKGAAALAPALAAHGSLTSLDLSNNVLCGMTGICSTYTAEGITAIFDALRVNGALTELSIYGNDVGDEGVCAICEAIQSNKETKLASLNFGYNGMGPVGANAVAAMVAVTGSLTKMRYVTPKLERIWV
jgi:Ran GTPase-activating protein (RanGAP) involved in mRNA processing and transport